MEKIYLLSLGCPKNLVDSELMLGSLAAQGYEVTLDPQDAEVVVVNTCAFIEAAKRESIDAILQASELKQSGNCRQLVVAGCLSQRYGAEIKELLPEGDLFVGTGGFLDLPGLLQRNGGRGPEQAPYPGAAHLLPRAEMPRIQTGDFFSAYVKVSEGCNHKCAFCVIPKIRGPHESRPVDDITAEVRALVSGGVREINLIAQDLTAYGRDLRPQTSLARLLRELAKVDDLRWVRLLYCYPNFVTEELLEAIASLPQVVKYVDMPLQHADDDMLRAMRRERSGAIVRRLLDRIRSRVPGVILRTSFIVGFPGETEAAFQRLVDFVREQQFDRVGVFTYSREENTEAYDLAGEVPARIKRERRAELMRMQAGISLEKNRRLIGREVEVLIERDSGSSRRLRGRTAGQAPEIDGFVSLSGEGEPGQFARARIEKAQSYDLHGVITGAIDQNLRG